MFGIWSWKLQSKGSGDMVDIFLLERWNRARELAGSVIRFFGYGVWELLVLGFLWEVLWGHSLSWWISPLHTIPLAARVQHYSDTSFWDANYCRDHGRPAGFHCSRLPFGFHAQQCQCKEWGSGKSNSLLWTTLPAKERGRLCLNQDWLSKDNWWWVLNIQCFWCKFLLPSSPLLWISMWSAQQQKLPSISTCWNFCLPESRA